VDQPCEQALARAALARQQDRRVYVGRAPAELTDALGRGAFAEYRFEAGQGIAELGCMKLPAGESSPDQGTYMAGSAGLSPGTTGRLVAG
jgi:hypothetical protein